MIQVRLADGSRLSAQFNNTHTVNDVRNFLSMYVFKNLIYFNLFFSIKKLFYYF